MSTLHIVFVGGIVPHQTEQQEGITFRGGPIGTIVYHYVGVNDPMVDIIGPHIIKHPYFPRTCFYTVREKLLKSCDELRSMKYDIEAKIIYCHMKNGRNDIDSEVTYESTLELMISTNPTVNIENKGFYCGPVITVREMITITEPILYHPVCTKELDAAAIKLGVIPCLMQGCHLLMDYHRCLFLQNIPPNEEDTDEEKYVNENFESHIVSNACPWVYSTSNVFTKCLIDGYDINPPYEGDYGSKAMINETEYRQAVARATLEFFLEFGQKNGLKIELIPDVKSLVMTTMLYLSRLPVETTVDSSNSSDSVDGSSDVVSE